MHLGKPQPKFLSIMLVSSAQCKEVTHCAPYYAHDYCSYICHSLYTILMTRLVQLRLQTVML